jgi:acetylornithine/succinyldiaminopimelate/putrescine aminotransferase
MILGTMALTTSKTVYRAGFGPLIPGVFVAPFPYTHRFGCRHGNDDEVVASCLEGLDNILMRQTAPSETSCVIVEPVLGEGGVVPAPPSFLAGLRDVCTRHDLLLVLDEVQTGMGRTGKLFAYEHAGIVPDIVTLAKGLGGGVPIGAMLATEAVAKAFDLGSHGSTFGGNALTNAAAVAVVETLLGEGVLANCQQMGERLRAGLEKLRAKHKIVRGVRGQGLLVGAELTQPAAPVVDRCRAAGLIINATSQAVLRFAPPLTVVAEEVDEALAIVDRVLSE